MKVGESERGSLTHMRTEKPNFELKSTSNVLSLFFSPTPSLTRLIFDSKMLRTLPKFPCDIYRFPFQFLCYLESLKGSDLDYLLHLLAKMRTDAGN